MEHPALELLSGRAYPELAAALRGAVDSVVLRWQEAVGDTLPTADKLTFAQIRDDLPKVLEQAAKALESDEPMATRKLEAITLIHGETRFHQNFHLDELLTEYCILRPVILQEVTERIGRPVGVEEASALMVAIDVV